MVELKGLPDQQEDATGTVRSSVPWMLVLRDDQSASVGQDGSEDVILHFNAAIEVAKRENITKSVILNGHCRFFGVSSRIFIPQS